MRKSALAVILGAVITLPLAVPVWSAATRVPPNSYLRKPVYSVDELAAVINKDPVVRNRFARHFGVPPQRLTGYIRENIIITRVSRSTPRNIYIVTRDGRMIAQHKTLRQGTPVFALRDTGEPLLVLACGNPVLKQLPPRERVRSEVPQVYQTVRPNEVPLPPPLVTAPPAAVPLAPPMALAPPVAAPPTSVAPPVVAAKRSFPPIPLLFIRRNNGKPPVVPPPPIPEPGGAATVIATAVLPAAGWAVRRFASRRTVRG